MFRPVRRMERRQGFILGMAVASAASRPRTTVVYGAPGYTYGYYPPPVQVIATPTVPSPATTQVIVNASEEKYHFPPSSSYQQAPPTSYQQGPPTPVSYQPPPPYQQPAYNPTYQSQDAYVPQPTYAPPAVLPSCVEVMKQQDTGVTRIMERRYFLLINEANCQVLQVDHGVAYRGVKLVLDRRRPDRVSVQRWYLDDQGVLRCALNDYAVEPKDGGDKVYTVPYSGEARQQWILKDNKIVNRALPTDCIGLRKRLFLSDDADVIISRYDNKPFQHWRVEYV